MNITQKLTHGALWNSFGFLIRFIIGFISSIVFVRLLGQYQYGIVTFILSCVFFAGIFVNLGLGTVMTQEIAKKRALKQLVDLGALLKQITYPRLLLLFMISILFWHSGFIANLLNKPYLTNYLIFIPIIIFTSYYHGTLASLLISFYHQKTVNITSMIEILLKLILVIIALYMGYGIIGFLIALLLSQFINGSTLVYFARKYILKPSSKETVPFNLSKHLKLAFHSYLIGISIRLLGREVDLFLIGILHNDIREVAIYAVVFGLPKMIFDIFHNMIGGGLGLTAFTELVKLKKIKALRHQYQTILHLFSAAVFPAIIGGAILGGEITHFFYGEAYANLDLSLAILFLALGISTISSVTADILYALNKGKELMQYQMGFGILNVLVNIMVISRFGALGVAVTTAIATVMITLLEMRLIHKLIKPQYPLKDWIVYLLISGIMGLILINLTLAFYWEILIGIFIYLSLLIIYEKQINKNQNIQLIIQFCRALK